MDVPTLHALRSAEGRSLLDEAVRSHDEDPFALGTRLRRSYPADLVAAALTQAELRRRARAKFALTDADRMFFTVNGLEQATRHRVSALRARRFATLDGRVADLCCGIGGDLIELARAGVSVTGVEADELTAAVASANVEELGLASTILTADATAIVRREFAAVMCDPARRTERGRVFNPDAYQPPWQFIEELLATTACVKVAPGIPHDRIPGGVEAEWVSDRGEVKEAALWSGDLADPAVRHRATLLPHGRTVTDADLPADQPLGPVGRWLIEPDGAVIRAGLVTAVASEVDGWLMDPRIAYVACDSEPQTDLGRRFEVVDTLPYDLKRLRAYVRDHHIGNLTIKKRGVDVDPSQLRRQLRPRGPQAATLIITRVADRATVLIADQR